MKQEQLFSKKELRLKLAGARGPFSKKLKAYVRRASIAVESSTQQQQKTKTDGAIRMKYAERKAMMEALNPDNLKGSNSKADTAEGHYRYYVIQLLADIADQVGSMAYAYGEMLKIQQAKRTVGSNVGPIPAVSNATPHRADGIPPTEQSRYGGR